MAVYTTYLANMRRIDKFPVMFEPRYIYYVMRQRGNDAVAPSAKLLAEYRAGSMNWKDYETAYLIQIRSSKDAREWMCLRSMEAEDLPILLVCFEKPLPNGELHCHRVLLAKEIERVFNIAYAGDIELLSSKSRTITGE